MASPPSPTSNEACGAWLAPQILWVTSLTQGGCSMREYGGGSVPVESVLPDDAPADV